MGIIIDSEKELKWIEGERRRQKFYLLLTILTFLLMSYVFAMRILPENMEEPIYWIAFLISFLLFMVCTLILKKSQKYLGIIDRLLENRRN